MLDDINWLLVGIFFAGWAVGLFSEWLLHWVMHARPLHFHLHHHKEFFKLDGRQVALNTIDPRLDLKFFALLLLLATPLMYFFGWLPVFLFWAGAFWHIVILYELCHALIHYDAFLPSFIKHSRPYRWWKGCHFEHHTHSPTRNYCITFPVLDWIMGTYVHPRKEYVDFMGLDDKPQNGGELSV